MLHCHVVLLPDVFAACSGVGAAFNIVCLALCFVFPSKNRPSADTKLPEAASAQSGCFGRKRSSSGAMPITSKDVEEAAAM